MKRSEVASMDVDAQKGFTPVCPAELPVPDGDKIVDELNAQAKYAVVRVGSKDAHPENGAWIADSSQPQFSPVGMPNVDIRWNRHCQVGTIGFQLLDGLPQPIDYDFFVWKGIEADLHPYGACYHDLAETKSTGIIEFLKSKEIEYVVVGGLATDYCVKTTVLQLVRAGFKVIVNLGACKGISRDTVDKAKEEMQKQGVGFVNSSKELGTYIELK
jgi:nicotinamidase/pyrazinamidase